MRERGLPAAWLRNERRQAATSPSALSRLLGPQAPQTQPLITCGMMPVLVREVRSCKARGPTPRNVASQGVDRAHPKSKPLGTLAALLRSPLLPYEHLLAAMP